METANGELMIEHGGRIATNQPRSADAPAATVERSLRQTDLEGSFGATHLECFDLASRDSGGALPALDFPPFPFGGMGFLNKKSGDISTMRRSGRSSGERVAPHLTRERELGPM